MDEKKELHELPHNVRRKIRALQTCVDVLQRLGEQYSPIFNCDPMVKGYLKQLRTDIADLKGEQTDQEKLDELVQEYSTEPKVWLIKEFEEGDVEARCPTCGHHAREDEYTSKPILSNYCPACGENLCQTYPTDQMSFASPLMLQNWMKRKADALGGNDTLMNWLTEYFDAGNTISVCGREYDARDCWELKE